MMIESTPFEDIFELFLSQVTDYDLVLDAHTLVTEGGSEESLESVLERNMTLWLKAAVTKFTMLKEERKKVNWELSVFENGLSVSEQYILAKAMTHAYLSTHVISEGNIKQALNSKDYRMYSPSNQLKALMSLQEQIDRDLNSLMSRYSWSVGSIKGRFKQ